MGWQITPYTVPLAASGVGIAALAVTAYRRHGTRGRVPLAGILVATALWCLADAVGTSATSIAVKRLTSHVSVFGQVGVTTCVFLFAAEYTNREHWLTRRRVTALLVVHVLTLGVVWTSPFHDLLIVSDSLTEGTQYVYHQVRWGPWNAVHTAYAYLLLIGATWMLLGTLRQAGDVGPYRRQTVAILVGMVVPWGMSVAYHAGLTEADLTALGFTVTGVMVAVALFRFRILDVVPVARSATIDTIDQGYLVLDPENTIVDVNETASAWLETDRSALVGQQFREAFRRYPGIVDRFTGTRRTRELASLRVDGEIRYFDVDISPIYDRKDRYTGRVCLFQDVTERERHKRRLERHKSQLEKQNERLEEFASIVAHDLRSPLAVFSGYLELLREETDSEYVETMESNVERMEDIIDDVLELARQGQTVQETCPVAIESACEDAWRHVDTAGATLSVRSDQVIEADPDRLDRVLENLFRNAVEHGSTNPHSASTPEEAGVTVVVGDLEDGFYVEDDGPGIPPEEREAILKKGYTTVDGGTGFGLSIVTSAVEAHGWELDVTCADGVAAAAGQSTRTRSGNGRADSTGEATGARFEISGVLAAVEHAQSN